ncbi:MAG: hypothetical protein JXR67_09630 [Bacteroidales bacterium]|nr:hypothetical protein [Bacteroidales bacterium]
MLTFDEREYIRPFPRPFIMDAMQLVKSLELSDAQRKEIAGLLFKYYKNCAREETAFFDGMIKAFKSPENQV